MTTLSRKLVLAVSAVLALAFLTLPAAASPPAGACTVTPNPVPVGTPYQVDATGLTANTAFAVHFQQPGVASFDLVVASDAAGDASTSVAAPTAPGTVSVSWKKAQFMVGGGGLLGSYGPTEAACSATVVA